MIADQITEDNSPIRHRVFLGSASFCLYPFKLSLKQFGSFIVVHPMLTSLSSDLPITPQAPSFNPQSRHIKPKSEPTHSH